MPLPWAISRSRTSIQWSGLQDDLARNSVAGLRRKRGSRLGKRVHRPDARSKLAGIHQLRKLLQLTPVRFANEVHDADVGAGVRWLASHGRQCAARFDNPHRTCKYVTANRVIDQVHLTDGVLPPVNLHVDEASRTRLQRQGPCTASTVHLYHDVS